MGFIIIAIIIYNIFGQTNPELYRKIQKNMSKIISTIIAVSIFSSIIPPLLHLSFGLLGAAAPFLVIYLIGKSLFGKKDKKADYAQYESTYKDKATNTRKAKKQERFSQTVTGLTRSVPKRKKIVKKFSEKYDLNLTEDEIQLIVDASYMSNCWESEIYEMGQEYDTIYQWYAGGSSWLRAYLHAFPVQNVTSDFDMQEEIVLNSFAQIFSEINPASYHTIRDCVKAINDRFLLNFDDQTFMIAYRFLESKGYKYPLPSPSVYSTNSPIEELQRKYDDAPNAKEYTQTASKLQRGRL